MRVLLAAYAERTTTLPMIPLAWGLQASGHQVLAATQPALVDTVSRAGVPVAPVGQDHSFWRVMRHIGFARDDPVPGFELVLDEPGPDLRNLVAGYRKVVNWWWRLVNDPMIPDMVALAQKWKPDVVVWETSTFAGALAAHVSGAGHARYVWTVDTFAVLREAFLAADHLDDPLADWLDARLQPWGRRFTEDVALGQATLTFWPESLRSMDGRRVSYLPVRYVPCPGRSVLPRWLAAPAKRRRIAVCFGSTGALHFGTDGDHVGEVVHRLAQLDVEIVVTTASGTESFGEVPDNVRVVANAPLDGLLDTCELLVSHGGPSTVATAMVRGVPQLIVPAEFDSPTLARAVVAAGAALTVERRDIRSERLTTAANRLIEEPEFARGASALAREAHLMPHPEDLAPTLSNLAAG